MLLFLGNLGLIQLFNLHRYYRNGWGGGGIPRGKGSDSFCVESFLETSLWSDWMLMPVEAVRGV